MPIEQATREQLAQLVNVQLEGLGIYASSVLIYPRQILVELLNTRLSPIKSSPSCAGTTS